MAVIRDVNLDTTSDNIIFIGTIGSLCLIVAVLGIKLRWFKHRMTFNDLPTTATTTSIPTTQSDGMEPKIIRATFKPSSEFDNYVEVIPPKVLPPVRIPKTARNAISLPPRKRQAPEVPVLKISDTNEGSEIEPLEPSSSSEPILDNLVVEERRRSTPPPPLPISPPPIEHEERLLLALEADYPYTESETIKIKEVRHDYTETILPSPPPYQENDPLAHVHFKKFTRKKNSSAPLPLPTIVATPTENDLPKLRELPMDTSPKEKQLLDKRQSFLNQVPTPTELPKLAFDFSFANSTPNLNVTQQRGDSGLKSAQSNQALVNDQSKSNEKRSLLEYFGLKVGSKAESEVSKSKDDKPVDVAKKEKKVVPIVSVTSKSEKKALPPTVAPVEKPKVKKIRVLKADKNENSQKSVAVKNEQKTPIEVKTTTVDTNHSSKSVKVAQQNEVNFPHEDVMENRMEIDYFQKVKKSNRAPIIVKSPKPDKKYDEKPPKTEVFRHEETFSAANGPLKVKKKKIKSAPHDTGVSNAIKTAEIPSKDVNQNISPSPKSSKPTDVLPVPKPRAILKLDGFGDDNRDMEVKQKPKKKVVLPALSSPSSPSDTEDAWNLVAKHRLNTRAIKATAISVRQKSESDETLGSTVLQTKQLEMLTKPKTMREMKREQQQRQEEVFMFGGKEDKESDTEA